jgi:hypothetical protein
MSLAMSEAVTAAKRPVRMTAINDSTGSGMPSGKPEQEPEGLTAGFSCDPPESAKDGAYLWDAETRLLLGRVHGEEALILEDLIAHHAAADCC